MFWNSMVGATMGTLECSATHGGMTSWEAGGKRKRRKDLSSYLHDHEARSQPSFPEAPTHTLSPCQWHATRPQPALWPRLRCPHATKHKVPSVMLQQGRKSLKSKQTDLVSPSSMFSNLHLHGISCPILNKKNSHSFKAAFHYHLEKDLSPV